MQKKNVTKREINTKQVRPRSVVKGKKAQCALNNVQDTKDNAQLDNFEVIESRIIRKSRKNKEVVQNTDNLSNVNNETNNE